MKKTQQEKLDIYTRALKGLINLSNDSDFEAFVEMLRDMVNDTDDAYATALGEQTHKIQGRKQVLTSIFDMIEGAPELLADLELKRSQRKEVKKDAVHNHFT